MYKGPARTHHIPILHDKKQTGTVADFHRQKGIELQALLEDKELGKKIPELKRFVTNYKAEYENLFKGAKPNTRQRLSLFQKASDQVFFLYMAKLSALRKNQKATIADLSDLMRDFIHDFPEGEKSLVHYQDKEAYKLFQNQLLMALNAKVSLDTDGSYTKTKNHLCAESLLLQDLSKLPIPLEAKADVREELIKTQQKIYQTIVEELIKRTTSYVERGKTHSDLTSMTMPLSALSYLDVMAFSKTTGNGIHMKTINPVIDPLVAACVKKILSNKENCLPEAIVRAIHSIILLSREQDHFKTYLRDEEVASLLGFVKKIKLDLTNKTHKQLANQLYQIKNVYPEAFPNELNAIIKPFINQFQLESHGSEFENIVSEELTVAADELEHQYPGLIDKKYFNTDNPICADLGLESDITYEHGSVLTCIQVDGNKFHQYPGTTQSTQRTKLRDYAFRNQQWQVVNFSDSEHGKEHAMEELRKAVVIPTFEMLTQKNIAAIKDAKSTMHKIAQVVDQIHIAVAQADLEKQKQQVKLLGILPANIAQKITDIESLLAQMSKASAKANVGLPILLKQLEQFDFTAASEQTRISTVLNTLEAARHSSEKESLTLQNELIAAQSKLDELKKQHGEAVIEHKKIESELANIIQIEEEQNKQIQAVELALKAKKENQTVDPALSNLSRAQLLELKKELENPLGTFQLDHTIKKEMLKKSGAKITELNCLIEHNANKTMDLTGKITHNIQETDRLNVKLQNHEGALSSPIIGTS
ncbi:MAG: hypothetical protein AB7I18_12085, partial [Candidatus Berkiella sp.]